MFTRTHHWTLSSDALRRTNLAYILTPYYFKIHFNIFPYLCLGLVNDVSLSGFLTEIVHAFFISPIRVICRATVCVLYFIRRIRDGAVGTAMTQIRFPSCQDFSLLHTLGLSQPPVQWISGTISPELKRQTHAADHSPRSIVEVEIYGAIPPLPHIYIHGIIFK
jgi:hypothetical protein